MVPKVPKALDVGLQYQTIHIEAYVLFVDMAYANWVAFKLTPETINTLSSIGMSTLCMLGSAHGNGVKRKTS